MVTLEFLKSDFRISFTTDVSCNLQQEKDCSAKRWVSILTEHRFSISTNLKITILIDPNITI